MASEFYMSTVKVRAKELCSGDLFQYRGAIRQRWEDTGDDKQTKNGLMLLAYTMSGANKHYPGVILVPENTYVEKHIYTRRLISY